MQEEFKTIVKQIDNELALNKNSRRDDAIYQLRKLGLSGFGELMISLPTTDYPHISELLPGFSSEQVQTLWTGGSGTALLLLSLDFVRFCVTQYIDVTGQSLKGKRILDYGCGYGRLSRLFYYYTDYNNLHGVDPWINSIQECNSNGLIENYSLSEYFPSNLPVEGKFDLIYAFSVFTHLDEAHTKKCLETMANYLTDDGLIIITVRPIEFWDCKFSHISHLLDENAIQTLKNDHLSKGFAFRSELSGLQQGYGDTSMSIDWIRRNIPSCSVVGADYSHKDPFQTYICLSKK